MIVVLWQEDGMLASTLTAQRLEKVLEEHGYDLVSTDYIRGHDYYFYRESTRPTTCAGGSAPRRKRRWWRRG